MIALLATLIFSLASIAVVPRPDIEPVVWEPSGTDDSGTGVVMVKLSAPVYPTVARAERISGDVELMLTVRQDGSVESAAVLGGSSMLAPAALDSARHTQFECRKCSASGDSYRLVYTFRIEDTGTCPPNRDNSKPNDQSYPRMAQTEHRVTTTAEIVCIVDPGLDFKSKKNRSLKCLYLWRCGS